MVVEIMREGAGKRRKLIWANSWVLWPKVTHRRVIKSRTRTVQRGTVQERWRVVCVAGEGVSSGEGGLLSGGMRGGGKEGMDV